MTQSKSGTPYYHIIHSAFLPPSTIQIIKRSLPGWWLNQPFEKYDRQNGFIFPNFRGWKNKYLSCHHLATISLIKWLFELKIWSVTKKGSPSSPSSQVHQGMKLGLFQITYHSSLDNPQKRTKTTRVFHLAKTPQVGWTPDTLGKTFRFLTMLESCRHRKTRGSWSSYRFLGTTCDSKIPRFHLYICRLLDSDKIPQKKVNQ